jgi:O-antigen/teichoic acid export membrane protein
VAAGFISFPILTRVFSVSDYGILSLITTTALIITAIAKLGFPESIVRFYAEFKSKNQLANFYSTFFLSSVAAGGIVGFLCILLTRLVSTSLGESVLSLTPVVSTLIFINVVEATLTSYLRAEQRTKLYNLIAVVQRYGSLFLGIFLVFFIVKGLFGFYIGIMIWGIVVLILLMYICRKWVKISFSHFSIGIIKDSMKFGFPLIWAELGHLVLNYVDRYLVMFYLGSVFVGLYTAGYNLASYATEMIIYPLNYAMTPIYLNILVTKGELETKEFFTKAFRYFLLIMFVVAFGFIAVGKDLIRFLATEKYSATYGVLPYVVIGQSIYACSIVLNNGLFIRKKTHLITIIMIVACGLNVWLNVILIPRFGIIGAAQATLIANLFYTVVVTYYAFKEFSFRIDYRSALLYLFSAGTMYLIVSAIDGGSPFKNLLIKIPVGAFFYGAMILVLDRDVRGGVLKMVGRT